jgi:hypothetical protein
VRNLAAAVTASAAVLAATGCHQDERVLRDPTNPFGAAHGYVLDEDRGRVAGAVWSADVSPEVVPSIAMHSGANGAWQSPALTPGKYLMAMSKRGYVTGRQWVVIRRGELTRADFELRRR